MRFEPIAIIGQSCTLPGALEVEALWKNVVAGKSSLSSVPAQRWGVPHSQVMGTASQFADRTWSDVGGYVTGFHFDASGTAVPADELRLLDPVFQMTVHGVREALRDAHLVQTKNTGLVLGNLSFPSVAMAKFAQSVWFQELPRPHAKNRFHSGLPAHLTAEALSLGGGAFALDAACASSLYAIKLACDRLHDGTADFMVAGAVNQADDLFIHIGFSALSALSKTGQSRPFHRDADGLVPAEGAGFVVLQRLSDARAEGRNVIGVIRGIGLSNDGRGRGLLAPSEEGQERAMRLAYEQAALSPSDISLVECHATGTPVGDATELRSMARVFAGTSGVPIGSLKSNLGHLITAAGVAGLIKTVAAMRHGLKPPTLHAEHPNSALEGSPFRLLHETERWVGPRRAAISAFGFGGNNAHLIVESVEETKTTVRTFAVPTECPIAIVGLGARVGNGGSLADFTQALLTGTTSNEARREVAVELEGLRFPPHDLQQSLAQQTLVLEAAREAARELRLPRERTAVLVGMGSDPEVSRYGARWRLATDGVEPNWLAQARDGIVPVLQAAGVVGTMPNIPANRINSQLDLAGPAFTVSAEEASGISALQLAARALRAGEIDAALVGAVDLSHEPVHQAALAELGRAAPTGDAAVVLTLKRLADARRDGDTVFATLSSKHSEPGCVWGDAGIDLVSTFGKAHAAHGLVHVAAAAVALHHGARAQSNAAATPWFGKRVAKVSVSVLGARAATVQLQGEEVSAWLSEAPGRLHVFSGENQQAVLSALARGHQSSDGPARLVIVAASDAELRARSDASKRWLEQGGPIPEGMAFRKTPLSGQLAFVFTGAAAAYPGMGRELALALPKQVAAVASRCTEIRGATDWLYGPGDGNPKHPLDQLWGTSFVCQLHAEVTRQVLGLKPQATIGYSSGESNALFAMGVWNDLGEMMKASRTGTAFTEDLVDAFEAPKRAWRRLGVSGSGWANYGVSAPVAQVREALASEPLAHLTIINSPEECVIGGEASACARVVQRLGKERTIPLEYEMAAHCPEVEEIKDAWWQLHHRAVSEVPGVHFYTNATGKWFSPTSESAADAITGQALRTLDFPRTIEQAWADGVRIFVEHGPRGLCSGWIRRILKEREHLAVPLDVPGRAGVRQVLNAAAWLVAAGVELDVSALEQMSKENTKHAVLTLPAHLPTPVKKRAEAANQQMVPAPVLEPVLPRFEVEAPAPVTLPQGDVMTRIAALHREFLTQQAAVHQRFLQVQQTAEARFRQQLQQPTASVPREANTRPGPKFNRAQLEVLASGKISSIFGAQFEKQDDYARQVRMPEPPLLLADRVTGIDAIPGSMGKGTLWTETDVRADSWYLDDEGRMPAGIMIESGQADLLLISWLGIDSLNKGERVYRLLGCELTYHGGLPAPGDTLSYDIHVDGHATQGDVRLFFFHYDCEVKGKKRLSVRNGQAGFFTAEELANSAGVLWDPAEETPPSATVDAPFARCTKSAFSAGELKAFSAGRPYLCFGNGWETTQPHVRSPRITAEKMQFLHEVTQFDPHGGPWKRGYLRAETPVTPDDWYFKGHFKNDPCMPGTLMFDGCLQAMSVYLAGMGFTIERDGWRFEPVPDLTYSMRCRGQVTPQSRHLVYEIFVSEVHAGPIPTVYADVLCTVDGRKAFHARRVGLRLVPDWPLEHWKHLSTATTQRTGEAVPLRTLAGLVDYTEPKPAATVNGFSFDYHSLLACAWGPPSAAFGPFYSRFDGTRRAARLPGPPYHFMSRVTVIDGPIGEMKPGTTVEVEYDVPVEQWYFEQNSHSTMPFCVVMEAALQPCGWLASYVGSALTTETDMLFRNLDGTGTLLQEILPSSGIFKTKVKLLSVSQSAGMIIENFEVQCFIGEQRVFEMKTVFGFFPKEAFENQVGLPASDEERAQLAAPAERVIDLTAKPAKYCQGTLRLPGPMLLMLDRITGFWPEGGPQKLGALRAEKTVNVDEWFFKAHFFQDPVQPGSLGVEALCQLLQFFMLERGMGEGIKNPRFEPLMLDKAITWKYRGQVVPKNKIITTQLQITEVGEDARGRYAIAEGWLWVDGKRIYHAHHLGMRIVAGPSPAEEILDPERDTWLLDHRPTWTIPALPMMSMVDRLAAAVDLPVSALNDVQVHRWLPLPQGPVRLRTEVDGENVTLLAWREASHAALSRFEPVASARVDFAKHIAPAPFAALVDTTEEPNPYNSGALFHGPAFQYLSSLKMSATGSSALLEVNNGTVPRGTLHQGILDAATHGLPHDEWNRWSTQISPDVVGYPYRLKHLHVYSPLPDAGQLQVETRFVGFDGDARFPMVDVQLIQGQQVLVDFRLVEVLLPRGPLGVAPRDARRRFLRDSAFVPGLALSDFDGTSTRLDEETLRQSDWLPGNMAYLYNVQAGDDAVAQVAQKEHLSRQALVHPSTITIEPAGARASTRPFRLHPLAVTRTDNGVVVTNASPPTIDLSAVKAYWRKHFAIGPWPVEDLYYGLAERFVGDVHLVDPTAFAKVQGRSCLYLANHQVGVESLLLSLLLSALSETPTVTLAKAEHRTSWLGTLIAHNFSYPGVVDPRLITFFDRDDKDALLHIVKELTEDMRQGGKSVLVHVEGTRALSAGMPVRKMSSAFIDMALAIEAPIIPVRLVGGLPVTAVEQRLEFPVDFGRQDYWVGKPIEAELLRSLPLKERKEVVLAAINTLGPVETPSPGDARFAALVEEWRGRTGATVEDAVLFTTLAELRDPSLEVKTLLEGARVGKLKVTTEARSQWLGHWAKRLFGSKGPTVEGLR